MDKFSFTTEYDVNDPVMNLNCTIAPGCSVDYDDACGYDGYKYSRSCCLLKRKMKKFSFTTEYDKDDVVMAENCTTATCCSVGYDLCANADYDFSKSCVIKVDIGVRINIPKGCYGRIAGRSSLAFNHGIIIGGGVIDPDYKGVIKVVMMQPISEYDDLIIKRGDRIAQLIIEKCVLPEPENCVERGDGGFGSTGK